MGQHNNRKVLTATRGARTKNTMPWQQASGLTVHVTIFLVSLILLASLLAHQADANPVFQPFKSAPSLQERKTTNMVSSSSSHPKPATSYNNIENLISELLDDVGNRLKKSKLHSMRPIKHTQRFGRSDPYMAPTSSEDEFEPQQQQQQRGAYETSIGNN